MGVSGYGGVWGLFAGDQYGRSENSLGTRDFSSLLWTDVIQTKDTNDFRCTEENDRIKTE